MVKCSCCENVLCTYVRETEKEFAARTRSLNFTYREKHAYKTESKC